jgi:hypothetical protein
MAHMVTDIITRGGKGSVVVVIVIVRCGVGGVMVWWIVTGKTQAKVTNDLDTEIINQNQDNWDEPA